jgi:hypothetical protein
MQNHKVVVSFFHKIVKCKITKTLPTLMLAEPQNAFATLPNLELLLPESPDAPAALPNLATAADRATKQIRSPTEHYALGSDVPMGCALRSVKSWVGWVG